MILTGGVNLALMDGITPAFYPILKKSECNLEKKDSKFHGSNGPWKIKRCTSDNPLYKAFFESCYNVGYRMTDDFNGANQEGFQWHDFNIAGGRRQSTAVAFLKPSLNRKNLHIIKQAHVTKILMDRKKAIGVEFDRYGTKSSFKANKEVILSSGAVNSPAILMHSGIGEANLLKKFDINVNHNLPGVGKPPRSFRSICTT